MARFFVVAVNSVYALSAMLSAVAQSAPVQTAASTETPEAGVVLTKLEPPVYPPLARQARVTGDVKIQVLIRRDGSVASTQAVSGHPMLQQAALESAHKSQFECKGCGDQGGSYSLIYAFGFQEVADCGSVVEERLRSLKCLYLWRCARSYSMSSVSEQRSPEVSQSPGRVTIRVSPLCIETIAAH
ncbi:MAG TPA: energy transducer TonB [Candidatus Binatus sp.]|jgi:TonB family protein|nr:energy transducer TonB [Candidatus Binatus sp.]